MFCLFSYFVLIFYFGYKIGYAKGRVDEIKHGPDFEIENHRVEMENQHNSIKT
jgi:hypothetical protein